MHCLAVDLSHLLENEYKGTEKELTQEMCEMLFKFEISQKRKKKIGRETDG